MTLKKVKHQRFNNVNIRYLTFKLTLTAECFNF